MKIKSYALELKEWAEKHGYPVDPYDVITKRPSESEIRTVCKLHPELAGLYEDSNGALVAWGVEEDEIGGLLKVPSAKELIEMIKSESDHMGDFDDEYIIGSGYCDDWWKKNLPIYRSLVKFYDEGNGDGIYISSIDNGIYFLFHDWMDWISEEPPMIRLSDSIGAFFRDWSRIQFANPNDLYWMSAVKDGKFTGFNDSSFMTHKAKP